MNRIIDINDLSEEQVNCVHEFIKSLRVQFQTKQVIKKEKRANGKSILKIIEKLHQVDKGKQMVLITA